MTGPPIRVALVDDHALFRESLHRLLEGEPSFAVVGDFSSAVAMMAAIDEGLLFDVALVDHDLSATGERSMTGVALVERLLAQLPEAHFLMVTAGMTAREAYGVVRTLKAGLFLKTEPIAELLLAIERTARGEQWISSAATLSILTLEEGATQPTVGLAEMTQRERAVLRGVLEGLGNKEIAARLELSESVIKAVLQRLFEKSGVRTRSQLVRIAIEQQILFD